MNVKVHRYLPPCLVLGAAFFFGWPASQPLDLGEDIVRASSVRWRAEDLVSPRWIKPTGDPFKAVLVASEEAVQAEEAAIVVQPTGPPEEELKAGLQLDGFADMGGRTWAVINGRPRLPGDAVNTADANRHRCEIVAINQDHVVVRCQETVAKILARPFGSNRPAARTTITGPAGADSVKDQNDQADDQVAPPPQA